MRRSQRRSVAVIADTPEPNGNISIVEDSVFDDSQVCLFLFSFLLTFQFIYNFVGPGYCGKKQEN